ncbi:MAG: hypothetical protein ABSE51_10025 [Terracidiphilus sp.]|jgi:hypothetical protein
MSIRKKATAAIFAAIVLSQVSCSPIRAQISCQDLKYGSPQYSDKMDELAKQAELPDNSWNRYHESAVRDFCNGDIKGVDKLVDSGMVKPNEAIAIGKVLGKTYKQKPISEVGKTYASSKKKFVEMGACSACADNVAQYYSRSPDSRCGKLAQQALDGNKDAIEEVVAFPDYCKWKY